MCQQDKEKKFLNIEELIHTGKPDEEKTIFKNTEKPTEGPEKFTVRNVEYFWKKWESC